MSLSIRRLLGLAAVLAALIGASAAAQQNGVYGSAQQQRATALLERAVRHIEQHGAAGTADFSRQAQFVDRDLYVYALNVDGRFLASGGASAVLIGENVENETDLEGRPFFREIIELAKRDGRGRIEYRWFNPADRRGEPKLTEFRRVGDIIVAVGYYPPRASREQAKALLSSALKELSRDSGKALSEFQKLRGPFIRDDLYVFVVDTDSGRFLAHGASPQLIGTDSKALLDPDGRAVVSEMLERAAHSGDGELDYIWRNPVTGKLEHKHTYFTTAGNRLVGVGYYTR